MATNRDLLAEAIADAKTVKATAIANAKAALEEAFTPHLTQMLSAKLQEMDTDEMVDDVDDAEAEIDSMDEVTLDELLAELNSDDEKMNEAKGEEKETETEESEEMSIEDMDEDDLKSFIEDVIKDMVAAGELEAGHEGMEDEEGAEEHEAGEPEEGEEEEIDVDALLEEEEMEEEVTLDELLAELEGLDEKHSYTTKVSDPTSKSKNAIFSKGEDEYVTDKTEEDDAPYSEKKVEKITFYESELEEAMNTIAILKNDLNEINLLNAKLLYTNKIFRSKSLTESQKVKVLTAFDKATSKKEVELVYETLSEGLKVSTISTKSPIKESLGSASRALGNATSKPIIENDAFARMRELAGIKK
jgi:hypothetical protein